MARNLLYKPLCHLLLLIILGILGYSNTLNAPFHFDDVANIVENPVIKNLDYYISPAKAKVHRDLQGYPMLINRYIGSLTFALNYKINKLDVTGYHVVNLLIHLINSLLIYWFVQLIFKSLAAGAGGASSIFAKNASTIAFFSSLLFATHPIQTQAVTYIVQRFTSLAAMFYLFSIIMYIKARLSIDDSNSDGPLQKINIRVLAYYLAALFTAILAMKTKEIAFTLPVIIVLYEFLFFKGDAKNRIVFLSPFILTMLIIPATLLGIADLSGGVGTATRLGTDIPRLDYLFTEFRVIITYLRLIFFPVNQNLDYDYPLYHSIFAPEVFLSFMSLVAIWSAVIYSFCRYGQTFPLSRVILFGISWFFITLSVESSIIPIVDVIFEHRMYLPSLGVFLTISTLLIVVIERCRQKWLKKTIFLSVTITALVFTGVTYSRNNVWNDQIVFWQDVVNKSPGKARGYNRLGGAYLEKGDYLNAIKSCMKATSLDPFNSEAYALLGIGLDEIGQSDEAIKAFKSALRINPYFAKAHNGLGVVFGKLGRTSEAIAEFELALQINPDLAATRENLGISYYTLGRIDEAIKEFRKSPRISPDYTIPHYKLDRPNKATK